MMTAEKLKLEYIVLSQANTLGSEPKTARPRGSVMSRLAPTLLRSALTDRLVLPYFEVDTSVPAGVA